MTCIDGFALNVSWPVVPVHAKCVDGFLRVVVDMEELHDAAEVVWLAWWFAYKVDMICE